MGTLWRVTVKKYDEEEAFARRSICGFCDGYTKQIVICDMSTYKGWEKESKDTAVAAQKQTLRHEIVHAFFDESGLIGSTLAYDGGWSQNEELVDWIANQGPKIYAAWQKAGAL